MVCLIFWERIAALICKYFYLLLSFGSNVPQHWVLLQADSLWVPDSSLDYITLYCLSWSYFWLNSTDVCAFSHTRLWKISKLKQHSWLDRQCSATVSSNITLQLTLSSKALSVSHPFHLVNQMASIGYIVLIQILFTNILEVNVALTIGSTNMVKLLHDVTVSSQKCHLDSWRFLSWLLTIA